jgi:hypothetical protein
VECLQSRELLAAPNPFQLSTLPGGNGSTGMAFNGAASNTMDGESSGYSVAKAGDVNGDGLDDLLISATHASSSVSHSGRTYLVFGTIGGTPGSLDLSTLNGSNGYMLNGVAEGDYSGESVSGAGDVNGDGFADLLIGSTFASPNGMDSGQSYLVFGGPANLAALDTAGSTAADGRINLADLNGTTGFLLNGVAAIDNSGVSVSGAGDVNGDGFADLLIGAYLASPNALHSGQAYLVFGGQANLAALDTAASTAADGRINLSALNGTTGYKLNGQAWQDHLGRSVSGAGDVNGDGFADLLIGASSASPNGDSSGQTYVIFGGPTNLAALDTAASTAADGQINIAALNGTTGFVLNGVSENDASGTSVSGAGDVNGDGFADLLIGAPNSAANGTNAGQSYLVFGGPTNLAALDTAASTAADGRINLSALNGTTGFVLNGGAEYDYSGKSVSGAGDVNGDGFADLLIGARGAGPNDNFASGQSYVVFGGQTNLASLDTAASTAADGRIELAALNGSTGFALNGVQGYDGSGSAVSGAGDVNGDGFADLLIAAPFASPNGDSSGQTYLVFGGNFTSSVTHLGTASADTLTGNASANVMNGGRGNDTLVGNGGADLLTGGAGDDVLAVSSTAFARVDGGNGSDTLRLDGSGLTLNLTTLADAKLTSIETIDIRGSGANTLILNLREVLNITQPSNGANTSNTLTVLGDSNDTVTIGSGWTITGLQTIGGVNLEVYTQGAATLLIPTFNSAPTNLTLSASAIAENQAVGTQVGTFSTTDPDAGNTFTYTLVSGAGDTDNASFTIGGTSGNSLRTAASFDFETKSSYTIRVRSTDQGLRFFEKQFTITVTNVNETPTNITPWAVELVKDINPESFSNPRYLIAIGDTVYFQATDGVHGG